MKKLLVFILFLMVFTLQFCTSSRKGKTVVMKTTYAANVQPIITINCAPCHIPPNNRKKAYDNYVAVKTDIDDMISRVQKNPDDKGFMPMKHPKLSDSTINVLVKWKADGLLEN